ncbi:MAG: hypothetical protein J2P16_16315 [Mycobacterium sp.]|nr:hypothetical protein [Mycobacterium sp.]
MSDATPRRHEPGRIDWWSTSSLRLHAVLGLGLAGCAAASVIEWRRALSGHAIAWVYAFEWPLFAVVGTWVWWRLLRGDDPAPRRTKPVRKAALPQEPDPQLIAWQAYLARLHAADPPGGPPER